MSEPMQIFVKGLEGKTFTAEFEKKEWPTATVADLKKIIKDKTGVEAEDQNLIYGGKPLSKDNVCLYEYGFQNLSTVMLVVRLLGGGPPVQIFLKGIEGKTSTLNFEAQEFQTATVADLKKLITDKTGVPAEDQRIIYGGKQLDKDNVCLHEYGLKNMATVFLVLRLRGGGWEQAPVNGADKADGQCMITLMPGAYKMPGCGHGLCSGGLVAYIRSLVMSGNWMMFCPFPGCKTEWSYTDLQKFGWFDNDDQQYFEMKLSENWAMRQANIQQCPKCQTFVQQKDKDTIRSICQICKFEFCWLCLHKWKGSGTQHCGCGQCSPQCSRAAHSLKILREAPPLPNPMAYCGTMNVPSIRACPHCNTLIEHRNGPGDCKHVECIGCHKWFCFLCVKSKEACTVASGSPTPWEFKCAVAPVQTSLVVVG